MTFYENFPKGKYYILIIISKAVKKVNISHIFTHLRFVEKNFKMLLTNAKTFDIIYESVWAEACKDESLLWLSW